MKKNNKKKEKVKVENPYETNKITKLVSIVLLLFIIIYMGTSLIIRDGKKDDATTEEAKIQYEEIVAGDIFNQGDKQYYVIIYDFDNSDAKYINLIINNKLSGEDALPAYKVDLGNGFNKSIIADKSNKESDITKLKVKDGSTLLRINNGKIDLFKEGIEVIKDYFGY